MHYTPGSSRTQIDKRREWALSSFPTFFVIPSRASMSTKESNPDKQLSSYVTDGNSCPLPKRSSHLKRIYVTNFNNKMPTKSSHVRTGLPIFLRVPMALITVSSNASMGMRDEPTGRAHMIWWIYAIVTTLGLSYLLLSAARATPKPPAVSDMPLTSFTASASTDIFKCRRRSTSVRRCSSSTS
ncbi:hypothetical protein KM043_016090 [Ampulex compressa]|nr:hypothetical protein KM043_016090 [Ampulex compressa]